MKHDELITSLKRLHLHAIASQYVELSKIAEKEKKTYEQYLSKLIEVELAEKNQQKVNRLLKDAKIPIYKSLESFRFEERTGITAKQFNRLAGGQFVREAGNIVFYGSFGVGKTHLAIALTGKLCEAGFRCLFTTTHALIDSLLLAKRDLTLTSLFKRLDRFDLITCDELGYVPHNQDGADLFFQLLSQRSERRSMMITTNLTYSEWDQVFLSARTTAAAVDRVIHNCETFNIGGPTWRGMEAKKRMLSKELTESEAQITQ
jgi:DNA replication protein DnaC